jgi:hypothetical protein
MAVPEQVSAGSSGVGQIDQLLKLIGGTKSTSTVKADTTGLNTVLQQALASGGDNQALLDSIFQQAGAKIPGIMGNTYNASGSRQAPGTLSPQLAQLQAQVTLAAQQQLAQQKQQALQTAAQAASGIANATRSTVTKEGNGLQDLTKTVSSLMALNKVAKDNGFDVVQKSKDLWADLTAPEVSYTAESAFSSMPEISSFVPSVADAGPSFGSDFLSQDFSSLLSDMTSSVSDSGGIDFSNFLGDSGSAAASESATSAATNPISSALSDQVAASAGDQLSAQISDQLADQTSQQAANSISSSAPQSSGMSVGSLLKLASYAEDDEKRKGVLDFSDGDWADDISDITDAAGVFVPPASYVRGGINSVRDVEAIFTGGNVSAFADSGLVENLANIQATDNAEDFGRQVGDSGGLGGPLAAVGDFTQDLGNFLNNPGEGLKDLFGW